MSMHIPRSLLLIAIALSTLLLGCGDDAPSRNFLSKDQLPGRQPTVVAQEEPAEEVEVFSKGLLQDSGLAWSVVSKHFLSFAEASGAFKDPFKPQIIRYVGRDELLQKIRNLQPESGQEVLVDSQVAGPKGPLQTHALAKYTPVIILTDADESKVVVQTPGGEAHVITKGTRVGIEGGVVHDITQYAIVYSVPGRSEHVVRSIKPALLDKIRSGSSSLLGIHPSRN